MLGFSVTKLLVLVLIVAVIWYGFKWVGKLDRERKAAIRRREEADRRPSPDAQDMVRCDVCGSFVQAQGARKCDRPDCPFPG